MSAGLTQNEVAMAMGTTQSEISRIERGTPEKMQVPLLLRHG
jgi:transcriptional regulator with XRE-family HTH domain